MDELAVCAIEDCERRAKYRGWCPSHYTRWRNHGDPLGGGPSRNRKRKAEEVCSVEGCGRREHSRGWCGTHYLRWFKHGDVEADNRRKASACSIEGCDLPHVGRGWCSVHYGRWKHYGDPLGVANRPKKGWVTSKGYKLVWQPDHPNRDKRGYVPEHVAVMAEQMGRPLLPGENVHHRNGIRDDNRPENLELWLSSQPSGQRVADLIEWANHLIERYGSDPAVYP
jgi:hypothetical protein